MKYLLLFLAVVSVGASAQTVINYEDGSTYTLENGQNIFVTSNQNLWLRQLYSKGDVYFRKQVPWPKRDYVPGPNDGVDDIAPVGSHEWCKAYVPWGEGLTFSMVAWQRFCDTNKDNKYGCGDDTYDASSDGAACPSS
tara:strand:- start:1225 stop:1638 length:414 start_codon:yes stop_codon:yes gene_type:complete